MRRRTKVEEADRGRGPNTRPNNGVLRRRWIIATGFAQCLCQQVGHGKYQTGRDGFGTNGILFQTERISTTQVL